MYRVIFVSGKHNESDIPLLQNVKIYQWIVKNVFHWEKRNFELNANSALTAELLALRKALYLYIDFLMFYSSRHVKWKNLKYKFTFNNEELILLRSERTLSMHLSARGWLFLQEWANEVMLQKWLLVQLILV